ncbi:MAG: hypothetical protein WC729_03860 [Sphingomonas sp.]|uniref:hypothetical protein n=1 Tax=Sphingomonas sp. TaxID=28214 RepID=UPI00356A021B
MKLAVIPVAFAGMLTASPALAEKWVTVFDDEDAEIMAQVDKDSIRRGADGLVYFTAEGAGKSDKAADCRSRTLYTLKLYVMNGIDYPDWRKDGREVVPQSVGEAMLLYACANA